MKKSEPSDFVQQSFLLAEREVILIQHHSGLLNLVGSVRSRGTNVRDGPERDLIEAGLNGPRVAGSGYGECVAALIPNGDGQRHDDGLGTMNSDIWRYLEGCIVVAPRPVGADAAGKGACSGVRRGVCRARLSTPGEGTAAALVRLVSAPGSELMICTTRMADLAATSGAAGYR